MQPTGGLGKVEPWAEEARDRAARIIFVSRARWASCWSCGEAEEEEGIMETSVAGNGLWVCVFVVALFMYFCAFACASLRARGAHKTLWLAESSHAERAHREREGLCPS